MPNASATRRTEPTQRVGDEQYLADLEVLQREENRIVEQGGQPADFFIGMADIERRRLHG